MTQKRIQEEILKMPAIAGDDGEIAGVRLMSDGSVEFYSKGRRETGQVAEAWVFTGGKWLRHDHRT